MRTISVGELRQNPTRMLNDVEAGEVYAVTRHNREIARITPTTSSTTAVPPKRPGGARTSSLPYVALPGDMSMDEFLDELKGEW